MGLYTCTMTFRGYNLTSHFIAGKTLKAKLTVTVHKKQIYLNEILVECLCFATTNWKIGNRTYRAREEIWRSSPQPLLNPDSQNEHHADTSLPVGTHDLPFKCQLPADLPTSYMGSCGEIIYKVKVTMCPINFPINQIALAAIEGASYSYPFSVTARSFSEELEPFELNGTWSIWTPTFSNAFCGSSKIFYMIQTPWPEFILGQLVPFKFFVDNQSGKALKNILVQLVQEVKYMGYSKKRCSCSRKRFSTKKTSFVVSAVTLPKKGKDVCPSNCDESIKIPTSIQSMGFTMSMKCQIIEISHVLKFSVFIGQSWMSKSIPIVIGNHFVQDQDQGDCNNEATSSFNSK